MNSLPVITAVDGSDHSLKALEWALDAARRRSAELLVVHIRADYVKALPLPGALPAMPPVDEVPVLASVREAIEGRADLPPVRYSAVDGSPAPALIELADEAQLLVLGSRGRGGFASLLLGSVSRACAARAACPVVVVPHAARTESVEAAGTFGRVALGLAPEETSDATVEFAFEEAGRRGAGLQVITTYPVPFSTLALMGGYLDAAGTPESPREEKALSEAQDERLGAFIERYPDVAVEKVVTAADAAGRLVVASQTADLLVVGRHRRRVNADSFLVGSAANAVLLHAQCPVAVVPA
ncbi:universal stress protein [Streptomyces formicae]|uniref:Universal stress protein family n=1 Tax=Streptomyces formicae TaxID=1616117 RepID=A0A291Q0F1_9ACTN|nr:universal stress protein [Streptomyces formicae]ATL25141.1 Universal stress protein family [Streptomyces formicae]